MLNVQSELASPFWQDIHLEFYIFWWQTQWRALRPEALIM